MGTNTEKKPYTTDDTKHEKVEPKVDKMDQSKSQPRSPSGPADIHSKEASPTVKPEEDSKHQPAPAKRV